MQGGEIPSPLGKGSGRGLCPENFSLLTLEKVHFGGYLMHSDILILKLWFAVYRMLQGCVTDSVNFFSDRLQFMRGLSPIASDELCSCLSPFSSPHFPSPPFLFLSFSLLAKFTRCSYAASSSL